VGDRRRRGAGAAMSGVVRLRFRLRDPSRFRRWVRLRFPALCAPLGAFPCTRAGLRRVSLCDISTPGCNYLRSSQASRELCSPLRGCLALTLQSGAPPLELAALRLCSPLVPRSEPAPVTSPVATSSVAHRVVAGRRLLLSCPRRSALAVLSRAVAGSGAVSGHPGHPSLTRSLPGGFGSGLGGARSAGARREWPGRAGVLRGLR
jgi:hypothetical protein